MLFSEEDLVETALLRYAQQTATTWGSKRFAAEFERRDQEERWLRVAGSGSLGAPSPTDPEDASGQASLSGLVDDSVQDRVIGSDRDSLVLMRPKYSRHSSVPRPPAPEPEEGRRRRRKRDRVTTSGPALMITPAEAARMSPAGRRLYGLDDPPDRDS